MIYISNIITTDNNDNISNIIISTHKAMEVFHALYKIRIVPFSEDSVLLSLG